MKRPVVACLLVVTAGLTGCAAPDDGGPGSCLDPATHEAVFSAASDFVNLSEHPDRVVTIAVEGRFEGASSSVEISRDLPNGTAWIRGTVAGSSIDARAVGEHWSIDDEVEGLLGYGRDLHPDGAAANLLLRYLPGGPSVADVGPSFAVELSADQHAATCEERDGTEVVRFAYEADGRRSVLVAERAPPHRLLSDRVVDEDQDHDVERTYRYEASSAPVDDALPRVPFTIRYEEIEPAMRQDDGGVTYKHGIVPWTQSAPFNSTEALTRDDSGVRDRAQLREGTIELDGGTLVFEDRDGNGMLDPGDTYSWDLDQGVQGLFHDQWSGEHVEQCRPGLC